MRTRNLAKISFVVVLSIGVSAATDVRAEEDKPRQLEGVTIQERLGAMVDPELTFTDHNGEDVKLGKYFGDVPVLLTLNYYRCTMLCDLQLNALVEGLKGMEWAPGENFKAVTVSIDPRETAEIAKGKRKSYLEELGRGDVDWTFHVGEQENIRALAATVGFGYRYDEDRDQYAHPAAIFFLSPKGKVSRYLYGIDYPPQSVKFALMEASEGRVGSPVDKLILSCFHYDASAGAYGPFAFGIMRLGGIAVALGLGIFLLVMWTRERVRRRAEDAA